MSNKKNNDLACDGHFIKLVLIVNVICTVNVKESKDVENTKRLEAQGEGSSSVY